MGSFGFADSAFEGSLIGVGLGSSAFDNGVGLGSSAFDNGVGLGSSVFKGTGMVVGVGLGSSTFGGIGLVVGAGFGASAFGGSAEMAKAPTSVPRTSVPRAWS